MSGILRIHEAQNQITEALPELEEILKYLQNHPLEGVDEPGRIYLSCYQALLSINDPRAVPLLTAAHTFLMDRATRLGDQELSRAFLEDVHANHALLSAFQNLPH